MYHIFIIRPSADGQLYFPGYCECSFPFVSQLDQVFKNIHIIFYTFASHS